DGRSLYSGTDDSSALVRWDLTTMRQAGELSADGSGNAVNGIAISGDGRLAAVAVQDGALLWDLSTGKTLGRLSGDGSAYGAVISADGRYVGFRGSGDIVVAD